MRSPDAEVRQVVRAIQALLRGGMPRHEIAVLYRARSTGLAFQGALEMGERGLRILPSQFDVAGGCFGGEKSRRQLERGGRLAAARPRERTPPHPSADCVGSLPRRVAYAPGMA